MQPRACQTGERYDDLEVVGYQPVPRNRYGLVVCRCVCGNEVTRRASLLKHRKTNNCGCKPRGQWTGSGLISGTLFYKIKQGAERRNLDFDLTVEQLWELYEAQEKRCALSGLELEFNQRKTGPRQASLDRIDSTKGYTIDNVQWVHKKINIMKNVFDEHEFVELCKAVARTAES